MSHFVTLVLIPKEAPDIHDAVSELLEPYDENMRVEPYQKECYCVGKQEKGKKPDPDCERCNGTVICESTYNPNSKWDWWQIGGRWSGSLKEDYNPSEDPRNQEICDLCDGTGKREDSIGNSMREQDPNYTCNGCNGKGITTKWPTEWVVDAGNIEPVSDIPDSFIPYSLIVSYGEWHQKGDMGWWGMSSNDKEKDDWEKECRDIFTEYADTHLAVVVDCHI